MGMDKISSASACCRSSLRTTWSIRFRTIGSVGRSGPVVYRIQRKKRPVGLLLLHVAPGRSRSFIIPHNHVINESTIFGWWFGTWFLFFHIMLGMSSSQLTKSIIFRRGSNHQPDIHWLVGGFNDDDPRESLAALRELFLWHTQLHWRRVPNAILKCSFPGTGEASRVLETKLDVCFQCVCVCVPKLPKWIKMVLWKYRETWWTNRFFPGMGVFWWYFVWLQRHPYPWHTSMGPWDPSGGPGMRCLGVEEWIREHGSGADRDLGWHFAALKIWYRNDTSKIQWFVFTFTVQMASLG